MLCRVEKLERKERGRFEFEVGTRLFLHRLNTQFYRFISYRKERLVSTNVRHLVFFLLGIFTERKGVLWGVDRSKLGEECSMKYV